MDGDDGNNTINGGADADSLTGGKDRATVFDGLGKDTIAVGEEHIEKLVYYAKAECRDAGSEFFWRLNQVRGRRRCN